MSFTEVVFTKITEEAREMLVALLSLYQYEGFEEQDDALRAFIRNELFDEQPLDDIATQLKIKYSVSELPDKNWNADWESNFQPVVLDDFCAVRADFHAPIKNVQYEIVITPKMSFGTGHHATTFMMMKQMKDIDFKEKSVFDFGTGTGVLAILAAKLGAKTVLAIDNDDWSISNAKENLITNNATQVVLGKHDSAAVAGMFDVILANITRNIILANFPEFRAHIVANGILLLSGLLPDDEEVIHESAKEYGFELLSRLDKSNWICLKFKKT